MFYVNEPHRSYSDPWAATFGERFRDLCDGDRRVAYFYEQPDSSTFRYRIYNMIRVLREPPRGIGAAYFGVADEAHFRRIVDHADVIVICRMRYTGALNEVIARARAQRKKVLFDVDDLVFDLDYVHLILKTLDQDFSHPGVWDHWFAYVGRIGATLKMCDGAITTNRFLAKRIESFSGLTARVVPNFMNDHQLQISHSIYEQKQSAGFARTDELHMGYFSGTPTHNHDFSMVATALTELMREDPRIRLLVVGYLELRGELAKFSDRITTYPLHDFVNLQRLMALVEINLVPLLDNGFTNCKSELKYFEAAAVGTVTVATPIYSYASAIADGVNGYLANSIDWSSKLRTAVALVDDGYCEVAQRARTHALARYAWNEQHALVESVLFEM
jgi:glycosyltransferase involved in cell wall biosynthesis